MRPITRSTYRKTATPVWTICHSVATISRMCTHLALCSLSFTCYRTPMLAGNKRNGTKQTKEITILDSASSLFLSFIPACPLLSSMVVCIMWKAFFIIHVSEEGHGGAEFFCFVLFLFSKNCVGKVRTRTYDLKLEVLKAWPPRTIRNICKSDK